MAAPATFGQFEELLLQVPLLEPGTLDPWLSRWEGLLVSPEEAAEQLVEAGLLTRLQADRILAGHSPEMMLGKYLVLDRLGTGGMGQVFLAMHPTMHRKVALKVLPREQLADPALVERFKREARVAARLDHPNLVHAHDVDEAKGFPFLVLEYIDGQGLDRCVAARGPLPPLEVAAILWQAAQGLQHAHEAGLVHRDIKPANLLIDQKGTVKILDMGIARFVAEEDQLTRHQGESTVLGTADYLSPEQGLDSHQVDIRSDLYSLGATGYFLLCGRPMFPEANTVQKLLWHQVRTPKPIREFRQDVPADLELILNRLLAKKPADRYATPAELAQALEASFPGIAETKIQAPSGSAKRVAASPTGSIPRAPRTLAAAAPRTQSGQSATRNTKSLRPVGHKTVPIRPVQPPEPERPRQVPPPPRADLQDEYDEAPPPRPASGRNRLLEGMALAAAATVILAVVLFFVFVRPEPKSTAVASRPTPQSQRRGLETLRYVGHTSSIRRLALSPDGQQLLTASHDGTTRLWETQTGKQLAILRGHQGENYNAAFSPDQKHFLTCGRDGKVNIYSAETRKLERSLQASEKPVHMAIFGHDGADLFTASFDFKVRRWNLADGNELRQYLRHEAELRSLMLAPDGKRLLSSGLDQAVLWNVDQDAPLMTFTGHRGDQLSGTLAPDGLHAFTTGKDSLVRVWRLADGVETGHWRGHEGEVYNLALHPEGKLAATGASDQTFRIWDITTGQLLYTSPPQEGWVAALAFTADGQHLVTGGYARDACLWEVRKLLGGEK